MNFFARLKKPLLILGFLILVALVGYLIWRLFFRPEPITLPGTDTPGMSGNLPTAGPNASTSEEITGPGNFPIGSESNGTGAPNPNEPNPLAVGGLTKTTLITDVPTLNPTLSSSGGVQYYNKNDGHFYSLNADGEVVALSSKVFHDVDRVVWAPDKNQAIIEYPDGNKILYNFQTEKQVTLPTHWEDFSFSPDSTQISSKSIGLDVENRWLMVSSSDGSKAQALENLGVNANTVISSWSPNNQTVAMYTKGVDFDRQEIFFVGLNGENFKSTIIEGRGLESQWSTSGDRLLYSVYHTRDNLNPRLWIVDAQGDSIGQNRQSLELATWASKCTFANNTEIYCAVPDYLEQGSGLFPELADKTKDSLYKIDLTTGSKKLIAVPDGTYNISQIMVPSSENYLYFTDKTTQQIYQVQLK